MSLEIQIDSVQEVYLPDGWYTVLNKSFYLDSYEYLHEEFKVGGTNNVGFRFYGFKNGYEENKCSYTGPISSIMMIANKVKNKTKLRD